MAPSEPHSWSRSPFAGLVAVAGLGLLAVFGAAWGGRWDFTFRLLGAGRVPAPENELPRNARSMPPLPTSAAEAPWWVRLILITVLVAITAALLFVIGRWIWRRLPRRTVRLEADDLERPDVEVQPNVARLAEGALSALDLLDRVADPKDAVVRAWLALELAAERSGVPRDPSATPSEFTASVLSRTSAEPQAVTSLLALYHRARFSSHPVEVADVRAARASVTSLAQTWRSYDDALRASVP